MYYLFFIIIVFLLGLYFFGKYGPNESNTVEGMMNNTGTLRCPNLLIQHGSLIYLYNSNVAEVAGVNPIRFENLEEYSEFVSWQKSQGIFCPILYLQHSYDIQSNPTYKIRPSVTDPQGGLPFSSTTIPNSNQLPMINPNPTLLYDGARNDPPYNFGTASGFDPTSQYVGSTTPLDTMDNREEHMLYSADAMKDNWDATYEQKAIDDGKYAGNEVNIFIP